MRRNCGADDLNEYHRMRGAQLDRVGILVHARDCSQRLISGCPGKIVFIFEKVGLSAEKAQELDLGVT